MKKIILLFLFFIFKLWACAQPNLVPNPSFEDYKSCPIDSSGTYIDSNINVRNWFTFGAEGGATYLNSCSNQFTWGKKTGVPENDAGYQFPKSGNAYSFFYSSSKEYSLFNNQYPGIYNNYLGVKLHMNCIARLDYFANFFCSATGLNDVLKKWFYLGDSIRYYTSSTLGIYLNNTVPTLQDGRRLELSAQINNDPTRILSDTVNWMEVSGSFEANGTEQYLFIGNFTDSANTRFYNSYGYPEPWKTSKYVTSLYYIDDVSLIPQNTTHYYDTLLCSNTPLQLGAVAQADSFEWNDGNKTDKIRNFNTAGLVWVKSWLYGGTVYMWDSLNIIPNNINSGLPKDTFMCNEQLQLNLSSTNTNANTTYLWNDGSSNKGLLVDKVNWVNGKTKVWLTITANYCTQTDTVTITQKPAIQIPITDTTTCFEDVPQILLDAGANFKSYLWQPTGETSKTVYSNQAQIYNLTVTDSFNCSATKSIVVDELCKAEIFIPNAFTPNNDNINDGFKPVLKTKNLLQYELKIYDSWGNEVFTTTNPNQAWEAKTNMQGVYVVTVNYQYKGFVPTILKGSVTLIR